MRSIVFFWLTLMVQQSSFASQTFLIRKASREYDLVVMVKVSGSKEERTDPQYRNGPAQIGIYNKGAKLPLQVLRLPNVELFMGNLAYGRKVSAGHEDHSPETSFVFDDFNFDGHDDLAVCNGNNGGYNGPSYTIFLFEARSGKFVKSKKFTRLNEGDYLGLFSVDLKKKHLLTFQKDGAYYFKDETYTVLNNTPVLIADKIDEVSPLIGEETITKRRLTRGKWVTKVKVKKYTEEN